MNRNLIDIILKGINLADETKEKAIKRYKDLAEWLNREDSSIKKYDPYVFPQGSFLLNTVIKPLRETDSYDLDLGCRFTKGISIFDVTQHQLKDMLGTELRSYAKARNIKHEIEEKRRCWRLEYQDGMNFHMDVVPCIKKEQTMAMVHSRFYEDSFDEQELIGSNENIENWEKLTVYITDNESPYYDSICMAWNQSNPEGFAKWFKSKSLQYLWEQTTNGSPLKGRIAYLPIDSKQNNTILHNIVKLLKRHRDVMYDENRKHRPISVIISKLAAEAYDGNADLEQSIINVITGMEIELNKCGRRIVNPTQELENFADKWQDDRRYEEEFRCWLMQAKITFRQLISSETKGDQLRYIIQKHFRLQDSAELESQLNWIQHGVNSLPKPQVIISGKTNKPWSPES